MPFINLAWGAGLTITSPIWATAGFITVAGCAVGYAAYKGVEYANDWREARRIQEIHQILGDNGYYLQNTGPNLNKLEKRNKNGSVDEDLPANPDDLLKDPGWKETTHPDTGKNGRRTFENSESGAQLEFDKGKPGERGHKGKDHYHRPNPNSTGWKDLYLDGQGNPVPDQSNHSHLYPKK